MALSSCEAEYMATSAASCQAVWLKDLIEEAFETSEKDVALKIDNMSAITLIKNPVFQKRSKHIKYRYHYIR